MSLRLLSLSPRRLFCLPFLLILIACLGGFSSVLPAQTAHFSGAVRAIERSGFADPEGVAVDASGNIFVADGDINEFLAVGGYTTVKHLGSGFSFPTGVAIDSSGNLFVADLGNYAVKEIVAAGGYTTIKTLGSGFDGPHAVAVDGSGNVFVADYGYFNNAVKEIVAAGGYTTVNILGSGFSEPKGVAVDAHGNVFVADYNNSAVKEIVASGGYTTVKTLGSGFNYPAGVALDASGNLFVADSDNNAVKEILAAGGYTTVNTLGPGFCLPHALAVTRSGNLFIAESCNALMEFAKAGAGNFPPLNVGDSTSTISLVFTFDTGGTLGSTAVLTQGATGADFANAGGGTCSAKAYTAGKVCTVNIAFRPKRPGVRYGAAELVDTSGNPLAVGYVQGTGVGPLVNFTRVASGAYLPAAPKNLASGFERPFGVAVDGSGNVFVADKYNHQVKEVMAAGGYTTVNSLPTGFYWPNAVAVDGNGNLFVAGDDADVVREIVAVGGVVSTASAIMDVGSGFKQPGAVAVDGSGNVFVADTGNDAVKEVLAYGGYTTIKTLGSGFCAPEGVAVDGSENVFVADSCDNKAVKEVLASGGYTTVKTIGSGFTAPFGVAVDGSSNVFVADYSDSVVKEIIAASGYKTVRILGSGFAAPQSVAVDGSGNVYVADTSNNRVQKLDYADRPSLTFTSVNAGFQSSDSPQKVTVLNIGNAPLTVPVPTFGPNPTVSAGFKLDAATTCPNVHTSTPGTLAQAKSCVYAVDFVPTVVGAYTGSLTLTDNNLNDLNLGLFYATQSIALRGNGLDVPFGALSQAVDSVTSSTTVSRADSLKVLGWVADPVDGAPLSKVKVYVDGVSIGIPTLGIARTDIAATYGNAYLYSGYRLLYPASKLALGTHQVTVIAANAGGRSTTFGPRTITVQ